MAGRDAALERGNIAILSVAAIVMLSVLFAVIIEVGCMYTSRMALDGVCVTAREELMQPAAVMQIESAEDPGRFIAEKVVKTLRNNGQKGACAVWVYESSQSELHGKRVIAYVIRARTSYHTMMLDEATFKLESMTYGTIAVGGEEGLHEGKYAGLVAKYAFSSNSEEVDLATTSFQNGPKKLKTIASRAIQEQRG